MFLRLILALMLAGATPVIAVAAGATQIAAPAATPAAVVATPAAAAVTPPPAGAATPGLPTPIPAPSPLTVPTNVFAPETFAQKYPGVVTTIQALFLVATLGLIALMSVQTTKTEGLSGTIGGRAESAYRGRLGFDQQLVRLTMVTAIAWILLAIAYFLSTR